MKEQLKQRLGGFEARFDSGQKMLTDLEARQANLREALLHISGAIRMLEEGLSSTLPQVPKLREGPPLYQGNGR